MKIFRSPVKNTDPGFPGRLLGGKDLALYIFLILSCFIMSFAIPGTAAGIRFPGTGRAVEIPAGRLRIYVDGSLYGEYDTGTDMDIAVNGYNGSSNTVHIESGSVSMKTASCRNQLCVKHAPIRYGGEEIICLPDRVVLRLLSTDMEGYDALSR